MDYLECGAFISAKDSLVFLTMVNVITIMTHMSPLESNKGDAIKENLAKLVANYGFLCIRNAKYCVFWSTFCFDP